MGSLPITSSESWVSRNHIQSSKLQEMPWRRSTMFPSPQPFLLPHLSECCRSDTQPLRLDPRVLSRSMDRVYEQPHIRRVHSTALGLRSLLRSSGISSGGRSPFCACDRIVGRDRLCAIRHPVSSYHNRRRKLNPSQLAKNPHCDLLPMLCADMSRL